MVHVNGHADDTEGATVFSLEESLNVAMDVRAKQFWSKMDTSGWPQLSLQVTCVVRWEKRAVEVQGLESRILSRSLKDNWLKSKIIPATTEVEWASFLKATRLVRRGKGLYDQVLFGHLWR